jgi:hypothetical protein
VGHIINGTSYEEILKYRRLRVFVGRAMTLPLQVIRGQLERLRDELSAAVERRRGG